MPADTHGPFPFTVVRDLLGITRGLYRAEQAGDGSPLKLQRLVEIGKQLRLAVELAEQGGPGSMGVRAAWNWAEQAVAALGEYVGEEMPVAPAVRATVARLKA